MNIRRVLLGVSVVLIVAAIWALSHFNPARRGPSSDADIPLASSSSELVKEKAKTFERAKELVDPTGFINTEPFTLASLIGHKVILVDFWTYSCINCLRTLPYLNEWYAKYKDKGFVIVGVHTPEFEFEKDIDNVRAAVTSLGVKYPVVLDSAMGTWDAYGNQYWPHEYLIDTDGFIVHDQIGEGGYDETEREIQKALDEQMARSGMPGSADAAVATPTTTIAVDFSKIQTPEIYLGSARNAQYLGNGRNSSNGLQTLTMPTETQQNRNKVYLSGTWNFTPEFIQNTVPAVMDLKYSARQVNIVAGATHPVKITILKDGVISKTLTVSAQMLYTLIDDTGYGEHTIEIRVDSPGLQAYTFTFS